MAFKMKGHTLPGIKQRPSAKAADGRTKSSALQAASMSDFKDMGETIQKAAPTRRDTGDVLTKNIKDTSQKGDDAAKTVELKSAKPGPAQSPEARKKIRANVTKTRKAAEASGESGTIFDATDEALDANYAAMDKYKEAQKYVKR